MKNRNVLFYMALLAALSPGQSDSAICFLPDCQVLADAERPSDSAKDCLMAGYQKIQSANCGGYSAYEYCPADASYVKCNHKLWCVQDGYDKTECAVPEYLADGCPNGEAFYRECVADFERACKAENENFVNVCPAGQQLEAAGLCIYSSEWGTCCNLCEGYDYKEGSIPSGYVKDGSCKAYGAVVKYKIKADPCSGFVVCPNTPKSGTAQCLSGATIMYKECCAYACNLSTCPAGTECSLEVCSNKYCATGCLANYKDFCATPITDCATLGYTKVSCAGEKLVCPYDGTKYYCF